MVEPKLASWEDIAKGLKELNYLRKSALQAIWNTTNDNMSPEEKLEKIRDIAQASGVFTGEQNG
jgi:hypothetical protein